MDQDTQMGGAGDRFPLTSISIVEAIRADEAVARSEGLERLIAAYWKPVYKYIRMKRGASNEEAKDLTQGFFARVLERDFLEGYDPRRASFRTYLRLCVDGYVLNERKAAGRQKRGGGRKLVALDFEAAEGECAGAAGRDGDEVQFFDRECLHALLERAVLKLADECQRAGKTVHFTLFERYDLSWSNDAARPSYDTLARDFELPVTQVTNYLAWVRRAFRRCALEQLRALSGSEAEFREEARRLFGAAV